MKCPKCQSENPERAKFCIECGHKFGEELAIEGERKQVTVLFTDLTEYTSMSERLDPEEVRNMMSRIFGEIAQVVVKYDGSIEKFIGDAVVAFFGVPKAHEDDPVRAIRAAKEIHEIVDAMSHQFKTKIGKPLSMHTGINTGLVVTGEVTTGKGTLGVTGDAVNVAQRLSGLAKPGEILVGEDTCHQTEGLFNFAPLTPVSVKGRAESIRAYKVLSQKEDPKKTHRISGLRAELIGRKVEMSQLKEAAQQLLEGKGAVFYITGDAGTGKSRLVEEFKATLDLNRIQWREGHSYAYASNIPYFSLMDLLSRAWQIEEGDSQERLKQKIEAGITNLKGDGKDIIPFIGSLYSIKYPEVENISPEYWKMKLHESIQAILSGLTRRAPAVICLEDLHWTDPSSIELLRTILLKLNYPALFLCVSRPQFSLFTSHQPSGIKKFYYEMRLQDLSSTEAQGMVESLLKTETIPVELRNFILSKAEGNPFYLEEVINSLIETETLIEKGDTWVLTKPLIGIDIPSTIQGVISARLDRLEKETKRILQEASVIGRVFLYEILKRVTELKEQIDRSLQGLERLDLIRARTLYPDLEYIFKHAITQEVAYNSLLLKRRREIHEKIGEAIEKLYTERLEEFYEMLAYHYSKSKNTEKAINYWQLSGRRALKFYAVNEGIEYFTRAMEKIEELPIGDAKEDLKLDVGTKLGFNYLLRNMYSEAVEIVRPLEKLAVEKKHLKSLGRIFTIIGVSLATQELKLNDAIKYLEKSIELSKQTRDIPAQSYGNTYLAYAYHSFGDLNAAKKISNEIISILEGKQSWYTLCVPYGELTNVFIDEANVESADKWSRKAFECAEKLDDPFTKSWGNLAVGHFYLEKGKFDEAEEKLTLALNHAKDIQLHVAIEGCLACLIQLYLRREEYNASLKYISELHNLIERKGGLSIFLSPCLALEGAVYLRLGKFDKTFERLEAALKYIIPYSEGYCFRLFGEYYREVSPIDFNTSEVWYQKALQTHDRIGMCLELARDFLSYGEMLKKKGAQSEAEKCFDKALVTFRDFGAEWDILQAEEAIKGL